MDNKIRTSTGWMKKRVSDINSAIKDNKKKIIGLTGKLNEAKYKQDMSPIGLAKETIKGLPKAAVKVGKALLIPSKNIKRNPLPALQKVPKGLKKI
jgi:hypothetical protein